MATFIQALIAIQCLYSGAAIDKKLSDLHKGTYDFTYFSLILNKILHNKSLKYVIMNFINFFVRK